MSRYRNFEVTVHSKIKQYLTEISSYYLWLQIENLNAFLSLPGGMLFNGKNKKII